MNDQLSFTEGSSAPRPWPKRIGPDSIGFGLVGASSMAWRTMVQAIRRQQPAGRAAALAAAWIVAVCSRREARARAFAEAHHIPHIYTNVEEMLSRREVRCVYVSTHPAKQREAVETALVAGKHVLCETPLALSVDEIDRLCRMAINRNLVLAVNLQFRAQPAVKAMRQLLDEGAIGDLLGAGISNTEMLESEFQGWRLHQPNGGVLLDRTIHDIDMLHYLMRDEVTHVFATSTQHLLNPNLRDAVEENLLAQLRFAKNDMAVHLHDSFIMPHTPARIELYGSRGTLTAHDWTNVSGDGRLTLYRSHRHHHQALPALQPSTESVRRFLTAVTGDGSALATGEDAKKSLQVVMALRASLQRGNQVAMATAVRR